MHVMPISHSCLALGISDMGFSAQHQVSTLLERQHQISDLLSSNFLQYCSQVGGGRRGGGSGKESCDEEAGGILHTTWGT